MNSYDVVVIGAGASGLFCAIQCAYRGLSVLIIENSKRIGTKILVSGGGRCNFTNLYAEPKNYLSENLHFAISALKRFSPQQFLELVETDQIDWFEKKKGQLFCRNSSKDILNLLLTKTKECEIEIKTEEKVTSIIKDENYFKIVANSGVIESEACVIATGGLSLPKSGATPFAYKIAKDFGLHVVSTYAGLVPFVFKNEFLFSGLQGLSFEAKVRCRNVIFKEAVLITHRGLSGPAILQISSYWRKGESLFIDMLPDYNNLEEWLATFTESNKVLKNILARVFPLRLAERLCETYNWNQTWSTMSEVEKRNIYESLKCIKLIPDETEGYKTAEVTCGGIDTKELSSKTMQSHKIKNLCFIGECVDVTGWLGGYNFQWAWASAHACAEHLLLEEKGY